MTICIGVDCKKLQERLATQGCEISDFLHDISFFAETARGLRSRERIALQTEVCDDSHVNLFFNTTELKQVMQASPSAVISAADRRQLDHLLQEGCEEYPFDLMRAMLEMYENRQKYLHVRILFAVRGQACFSNNFACMATFVKTGDVLQLQPLWNGMWWESMQVDNNGFSFEQDAEHIFMNVFQADVPIDPNFEVAMRAFIHRTIMSDENKIMTPFLTTGRRNRPAHAPVEMITKFNGLTYVQTCMAHFFISHMHQLLQQTYPVEMTCHILQKMTSNGIQALCENTLDQVAEMRKRDIFMLALVRIALQFQGAYRPDVNGEDIALRFDLQPHEEKTADTPLLAGGDCEDMAQVVMSMLYSIKTYGTLPDFQRAFPWLQYFLSPAISLQWRVCIARGTCLQQTMEENHTFVVCVHIFGSKCVLSVVETVASFFVVQNSATDHEIEALSNLTGKTTVIREESAACTYQHVVLLDEFLVFEYCKYEDGASLHLGAATFLQYEHFFEVSDATDHSVFAFFLKECHRSAQEQGDHRVLLLITRELFYVHFASLSPLMKKERPTWESFKYCPRDMKCFDFESGDEESKNVIPSSITSEALPLGFDEKKHVLKYKNRFWKLSSSVQCSFLVPSEHVQKNRAYSIFSNIFMKNFVVPFYQENSKANNEWTHLYFQFHPNDDNNFSIPQLFIQITNIGKSSFLKTAENQLYVAFKPRQWQQTQMREVQSQVQSVVESMAQAMLSPNYTPLKSRQDCMGCCPREDSCLLRRINSCCHELGKSQCGISRQILEPIIQEVQTSMHLLMQNPSKAAVHRCFQSLLTLLHVMQRFVT